MMTTALSLRQRLLADAVRFIRAARKIDGVTRTALLGSILTAKREPKDVDLLLTVENGLDLAPLAVTGRRLKGRAQSHAAGADIFLADPAGNYIGRICEWKECRFGIRVRCDARHCGACQYLHDDLDDVCLDTELIQNPPLELWPRIVARVAVPDDVNEIVVTALNQTG